MKLLNLYIETHDYKRMHDQCFERYSKLVVERESQKNESYKMSYKLKDLENANKELVKTLQENEDSYSDIAVQLEIACEKLAKATVEAQDISEACDKLIDENHEYSNEIDRLNSLVDSLQEDELAIRCRSLEDELNALKEWRKQYRAKRTASQKRRRERIKENKKNINNE